jgi:lipopolysaccharide/colanic/teichoic acid biosynthesis glycosyltransferase
VLRGDMALIGPRPLLRRELPDYADDVFELYKQVRPGITGLWQVSGRSQTSFAERANYDSWYVRNWSIWVDWVILLKTVRVVLSAKGAV